MTAEPDWYAEHLAAFAVPRPAVPTGRYGPGRQWTQWWQQHPLDEAATVRASEQGFVLRSDQLPDLGVTRSAARHAVRRGRWCVPMRGFVGVLDVGADGAPEHERARRRHAMAAAAAALSRPGVVVSGRSAAILHGLPTVGIPDHPEVTREHCTDRAVRGGAHVYAAGIPVGASTTWFGIPVTTPTRTVVDVCRHSREDGIAVADAALRDQLATRDGLGSMLDAAHRWPGVVRARGIVELADPRSESLLESVLRLRMHDDGFPEPRLQHAIAGYFVDLALVEHGLVVEADGRVKYSGDGDALWREKRRETAIRHEGWWIERVLFRDVFRDWPRTSLRLRARLRDRPTRW